MQILERSTNTIIRNLYQSWVVRCDIWSSWIESLHVMERCNHLFIYLFIYSIYIAHKLTCSNAHTYNNTQCKNNKKRID